MRAAVMISGAALILGGCSGAPAPAEPSAGPSSTEVEQQSGPSPAPGAPEDTCALDRNPITVGSWTVRLATFDRSAPELRPAPSGKVTMAVTLELTTDEPENPYYLDARLVSPDERRFPAAAVPESAYGTDLAAGQPLAFALAFPLPTEYRAAPLVLDLTDRAGAQRDRERATISLC